MSDPKSFYSQNVIQYGEQIKAVQKKLRLLGFLRLLSFLILIAVVYQFWGQTLQLSIGFPLGLMLFLFLVFKYKNQRNIKQKLEKLLDINVKELKVLDKQFDFLDSGSQFIDPLHEFSHDIDLFGDRSFFQYSNRSATSEGKVMLAGIFTANTHQNIQAKQQAIKELAAMPQWRQEFSAIAALVKTELPNGVIQNRLRLHKPIVKGIFKSLPLIFSIGSIVIFTLAYLNMISGNILMYWLILGLTITGYFFKRISVLSNSLDAVQDSFRQYQHLISLIENTTFQSELLKEQQNLLINKVDSTSGTLKKFAKAIDALEQRNNLLVSIPGNGFLLLDIYNTYKVEKWISQHKDSVEKWFDVVSFFDAYNSLGNFAFNHPSYSYPEISDGSMVIKAEGLGHPLIKEQNLVSNAFDIDKGQFFVITGANMAGKSTFLRTISLYIMMANTGLPVCAQKSVYSPIKLITSMRTIDSLAEDASYFYAELKRLKYIVDKVKEDRYFIVLDEILKGTNSKDKEIGSKKFIQKLTTSESTGIIATHDLSLCELSGEYAQVKNYFFEAFIQEGNLSFDYTLKPGKCENMNAYFLLQSMGII